MAEAANRSMLSDARGRAMNAEKGDGRARSQAREAGTIWFDMTVGAAIQDVANGGVGSGDKGGTGRAIAARG